MTRDHRDHGRRDGRGGRDEPVPGVSITPAHDNDDNDHNDEHEQRDGQDGPDARETTMRIIKNASAGRRVDLDDVSGCPVASLCLTCGTGHDLIVATVDLDVFGMGCVTVCRADLDGGRLPALSAPGAAHLAMEHCGHLGITADQMAALIEGGGRR